MTIKNQTKFAILLIKHRNMWMNSGLNVSADRDTAIKQFEEFKAENAGVRARLIEVTAEGFDGETVAE